jgi:hypothetical protein
MRSLLPAFIFTKKFILAAGALALLLYLSVYLLIVTHHSTDNKPSASQQITQTKAQQIYVTDTPVAEGVITHVDLDNHQLIILPPDGGTATTVNVDAPSLLVFEKVYGSQTDVQPYSLDRLKVKDRVIIYGNLADGHSQPIPAKAISVVPQISGASSFGDRPPFGGGRP